MEADSVPLNGTIIIGQEQDSYGGTFANTQVCEKIAEEIEIVTQGETYTRAHTR